MKLFLRGRNINVFWKKWQIFKRRYTPGSEMVSLVGFFSPLQPWQVSLSTSVFVTSGEAPEPQPKMNSWWHSLSQRGAWRQCTDPLGDRLRRDCMQILLSQNSRSRREEKRRGHYELQPGDQFSQSFISTTVYDNFLGKVQLLHVQDPVTKNPTLG